MNSTVPDGIQTIEHKNIRKPPGTSIMICSAAISIGLYRIINEAEQSAFQVSLAAKQQSLISSLPRLCDQPKCRNIKMQFSS